MNRISLKKVCAAVRKYNSFLITVHTSPEGDALGSELALYYLLNKLGKRAVVVNKDPVPPEYGFMPGKDNIRIYRPDLPDLDFDCMVVLDCTDLERTSDVHKLNKDNKPVINIDNHISNNAFGSVNWIDPKASSASEMVFELYKEMRVPFDRDPALLLYTGIVSDTGSFRYSNTRISTHKAAAELMHFGINPLMVYKNIYENISFIEAKLTIRALAHIHRSCGGKIVWVEVPAKSLRHRKVTFDLADHILSFMRAIKDAEVAALFKENLGEKNEIRFNLRSNGRVDVNEIAQAFGGGGHKAASGCTTRGKLSEVRRKVVAKIRQQL